MKIVILIFFILIFISLASALAAMMKGDHSDKMVKSLTIRIGLSFSLFLLLIFAGYMGWITPHQIQP